MSRVVALSIGVIIVFVQFCCAPPMMAEQAEAVPASCPMQKSTQCPATESDDCAATAPTLVGDAIPVPYAVTPGLVAVDAVLPRAFAHPHDVADVNHWSTPTSTIQLRI